eukprot:2964926-Prymnesium_polylepis.1
MTNVELEDGAVARPWAERRAAALISNFHTPSPRTHSQKCCKSKYGGRRGQTISGHNSLNHLIIACCAYDIHGASKTSPSNPTLVQLSLPSSMTISVRSVCGTRHRGH